VRPQFPPIKTTPNTGGAPRSPLFSPGVNE
jgi:hypothetical protein